MYPYPKLYALLEKQTFPFEYDDATAITTRRELHEQLANSNHLAFVYHFAFPGLGYIKNDAGTYMWQSFSE